MNYHWCFPLCEWKTGIYTLFIYHFPNQHPSPGVQPAPGRRPAGALPMPLNYRPTSYDKLKSPGVRAAPVRRPYDDLPMIGRPPPDL